MSSEASEKTEQPSEHKLREARKKGQVAKSTDLPALSSLFFALMILVLSFEFFFDRLLLLLKNSISIGLNQNGISLVERNALLGFDTWLLISLPVLLAAGFGALVGNVSQFGFLFSTEPIKFDLKKVDPLAGIKKLFSKNRLVELLKQVVKFTLVLWVIYVAIKDALPSLSLIFRVPLAQGLQIFLGLIKAIFIRVLLCFLAIAIADFFWQRFSFLKSMRMSKYEVKKEYKQQEGDPEIKHERRRVQQETLEAIATASVGEASVVITNPTHLAVALKYDEDKDDAPRVIAKGIGTVAKSMIETAKRNNVHVMRNVPLARDLQWLDINEEIPERLYDAVAEVLTFINELNQKQAESQS